MRAMSPALIAAAVVVGLAAAGTPAVAAPQGIWVQPAADLSVTGGNADAPQVAVAADGTATSVWLRFNGSHYIVQAATRPPGGPFGTPVNLSATGQQSYSPQVTSAPDGTTTAVWKRYSGTDFIIQAAIRPPGGSFGTPVDLSATGQPSDEPQVSAAPDGTTTAVWRRSNGANYIVQAAIRPPGGSFGAPVDLSVAGLQSEDPQVTTAPDGTVTVVWRRYNGSHYIVQAATRPPGGSFGAPVDLSAAGQNATGPQIASALDGTATAIWNRFGFVQAATRPPGGSFETPVDLSVAGGNTQTPQIAIAPDGTATAIWNRYNGSNFIIQAAARPPGGSFEAPVDLSATGTNALSPQVAVASDGTATAIWTRYNGSNYIVQAATRPPGGLFSAPVGLSVTGQEATDPQITTASDGVVTAVWLRSNGIDKITQSMSTSRPSPLLSVSKTGSGSGTVTSTPAGINCGADCAENYLSFTTVSLTATPDPGSTFAGWSGAGCSGTGTCLVTLTSDEIAIATFAGKAKISKVKISGPSKVKKRKKAIYKVKIMNSGKTAATGVKLQVKGKGIKVKKKVGQIPAGKTKTVKVKLKFKKPGKAKTSFKVTSSNAGGKTVKKKITVKK